MTYFDLPSLSYDYSALEPYIDGVTMKIHHLNDHKIYIDHLNKYLDSDKGSALKEQSIEEIVSSATEGHLRNNAGGYYNHCLFWKLMAPPGTSDPAPHGNLKTQIEKDFGSLDAMKKEFGTKAAVVFGSGWVWLGVKSDGSLGITSTPNQDNPLMPNMDQPMIPILGVDVWEHAYFLKYRNRRPEYIEAFWNITNWDQVVDNYEQFASKNQPVKVEAKTK